MNKRDCTPSIPWDLETRSLPFLAHLRHPNHPLHLRVDFESLADAGAPSQVLHHKNQKNCCGAPRAGGAIDMQVQQEVGF